MDGTARRERIGGICPAVTHCRHGRSNLRSPMAGRHRSQGGRAHRRYLLTGSRSLVFRRMSMTPVRNRQILDIPYGWVGGRYFSRDQWVRLQQLALSLHHLLCKQDSRSAYGDESLTRRELSILLSILSTELHGQDLTVGTRPPILTSTNVIGGRLRTRRVALSRWRHGFESRWGCEMTLTPRSSARTRQWLRKRW